MHFQRQPGNKILYDDDYIDGQSGIVKCIELKPEINHNAVGKVKALLSDKKNRSTTFKWRNRIAGNREGGNHPAVTKG